MLDLAALLPQLEITQGPALIDCVYTAYYAAPAVQEVIEALAEAASEPRPLSPAP